MAIPANQQNIIALSSVMFNAAPGADYLAEFENYSSLEQLADNLAATPAFNSQFAGLETQEEKIAVVLTQHFGLEAGSDAYEEAMTFFDARLNAGVSPTDVLIEAGAYLLGDNAAPEFAEAAQTLENKIEVGTYYSVTQGRSADSVQELQSVVASVTADEASVEAAKAAIDEMPAGEEPETPPVEEEPATPTNPGDGGQGNEEDSSVPTFPENQILTVDEISEDTNFYSSDDLADYQAIRFSNIVDNQQATVEGLSESKWVLVENSSMTLNLNETATGKVVLTNSTVELLGDTQGENYDPTGLLETLDLTVTDDSTLDLSGSATYGLTNVTLTGPGSLEMSGSALADNATVDASGMAGKLTVEAGMLDNAASVTAGSGNDELTVDDFTAANGNVASFSGGAGTDTLTVSSSVQVPEDANASVAAVEAGVSGFETVAFGGYSQVDAQDFQDTENFIFASGGDISNLEGGQTVTVTGLSSSGSGPIIRDASGDLNIVTDFETDGETLDLGVFDEIDASGGTLSLSGNGSVEFEVAGREFDTINAEELEGGLEFTGVTYHQENVTLGAGSDTLHVTDSSIYGSDGNRMDSVTGFDAGNDTLAGIEGITQVNVESATSLEEAFSLASSNSTDGNYVAFEQNGNTYIYADTETQATNPDTGVTRDTTGPSYNDFAIELTGVSVTDVMGSIA